MSNHFFRKSKEKGFNDINFKLIVSKASWFQDECGILIIIEWICLIYFLRSKQTEQREETYMASSICNIVTQHDVNLK